MGRHILFFGMMLLAGASAALAQQVSDTSYAPPLSRPAYETGKGPRVAIDQGHHNFHTASGRYRPFADLLRRDGFRVDSLDAAFSPESLRDVDVLVVSNALNERNAEDWALPTPSAFTAGEIAAVRSWVEKGGSLLLIADHMPFAGAATELARAFGAEYSNGYARSGTRAQGQFWDVFEPPSGLPESAVTRGRSESEKITKVATFTGSAFTPPKEAEPVLVFGAGSVCHETKRAGEITSDTPAVPVDGWCQGAIMEAGEGRVAMFGEAAMFSAQLAGPNRLPVGMNSPEAPQNFQLLINVMRWLGRTK